TNFGPLVSFPHRDPVLRYVESGKRGGARLPCGGEALKGDGFDNGAWVAPTVFTDCSDEMTIVREEIFGPVLVVTRFKSEEEALKLANDSDYGLGAAVWTHDLSRAHRMSRRLKAGSVFVNNYNDGDMTVPFGGYKQSGNGRDKSLHA
ncbi:aldehyde dehydrogenase family protein, partial [Mycobacterium tuberculosis]|nr:aldehyde dehydrogenase family protein [Mycobacterium tuberculosis]